MGFLSNLWDEVSGNAGRRRAARRESQRDAQERYREKKKRYDEGYRELCEAYNRTSSERVLWENLEEARKICGNQHGDGVEPAHWIEEEKIQPLLDQAKAKIERIKLLEK